MVSVLQSEDDIKEIARLTQQQAQLVGDMAELGVYEGGSAKVICENKGDRALYLFDTFTGLPQTKDIDGTFKHGDYACQSFKVEELLKDFSNVHFCAGLFPLTTKDKDHLRFSFVHFDGDIYQSCKDAIEYFYPRLVKGGLIIFHDFHGGVEQAVAESGLTYKKTDTHAIISKP